MGAANNITYVGNCFHLLDMEAAVDSTELGETVLEETVLGAAAVLEEATLEEGALTFVLLAISICISIIDSVIWKSNIFLEIVSA